jgi:hypothetical protein
VTSLAINGKGIFAVVSDKMLQQQPPPATIIIIVVAAILGCFVPSCKVLPAEAFVHHVAYAPLWRIRIIPTRVRIGLDPPALAPPAPSSSAGRRSTTTTSTFLQATIKFTGDSSSRLQVNLPIQPQDKKEPHAAATTSSAAVTSATISFGEWLLSSDSDSALLGTTNFVQRADGNWDAKQPRIAWFGIDVVPVFVNQIDRRNSQNQNQNQPQQQQDQQFPTPAEVVVSIVNARTDILGKTSGPNQWIANLMKTSTFVGQSRVKAMAVDVLEATTTITTTTGTAAGTTMTTTTWDVSVELELTLQIPLPFYVLLPLGFNKIGNRIVQTTCNARTKRFLEDLVTAYQTEQTTNK